MDRVGGLAPAEIRVMLSGEIDEYASRTLREKLDRLIDEKQPSRLVLDLSGVSFVDSTGLGLIFGRYKKLNARGGELALVNVPRQVDRVLAMSGVYSFVEKTEKFVAQTSVAAVRQAVKMVCLTHLLQMMLYMPLSCPVVLLLVLTVQVVSCSTSKKDISVLKQVMAMYRL